MRRRIAVRVTVLALVVLLAIEGIALAISYTAPTSLSLGRRPIGVINRGTRVTFFGKLSSPRPACERYKVIQLIRVGTGVVAMTRTNSLGRYRFVRRIWRRGYFRTRFQGTAQGVHPNIKVCLASRSRTRLVRVR